MDNNYTTELSNYIKRLSIDPSLEYSEELSEFINMHNISISQMMQQVMNSTLLSLLIKKGIITDKEYIDEFKVFMNTSKQFKEIESNRDKLLQCIEVEMSYKEELKNKYNGMVSRITDNSDSNDPGFYNPNPLDSDEDDDIIHI